MRWFVFVCLWLEFYWLNTSPWHTAVGIHGDSRVVVNICYWSGCLFLSLLSIQCGHVFVSHSSMFKIPISSSPLTSHIAKQYFLLKNMPSGLPDAFFAYEAWLLANIYIAPHFTPSNPNSKWHLLSGGRLWNVTIILRFTVNNLRMQFTKKDHQVIFHYDYTYPHTGHNTISGIQQLGWEVIPHPFYFLDLAPSDFHLFCLPAKKVRGISFNNNVVHQNWLNSLLPNHRVSFGVESKNCQIIGRQLLKNGGENILDLFLFFCFLNNQ